MQSSKKTASMKHKGKEGLSSNYYMEEEYNANQYLTKKSKIRRRKARRVHNKANRRANQ